MPTLDACPTTQNVLVGSNGPSQTPPPDDKIGSDQRIFEMIGETSRILEDKERSEVTVVYRRFIHDSSILAGGCNY